MTNLLAQLRKRPQRLFLIDCLGAVVSCLALWILFVMLVDRTGIPGTAYKVLAGIALAFAIHSGIHHRAGLARWQLRLRIVALGNLAYGALTAALIVRYHRGMAALEYVYLIGELVVIIALAAVELTTAARRSTR